MLELHISEASEDIVVTLTEKKTLSEPYYLFVFTHVTTKQVVNLIMSPDDDQSEYPARYNKYTLATATVFDNKPAGQWIYSVYEQESSTNTTVSNTASLVENGKMILYAAEAFEFEKYNESTSYKTYNG
jgi:hypothetical protein